MGSVLLHTTVAVLLLVSWNFTRDLKVGSVVPVTIVSEAPASDVRQAEQAPVEQTALADAPVPDAPLQSTPPAPEPKPAPPPPTPKPTPTPKLVKPVPAPAPVKPAAPARPEKSLDLDALSASVSKMARAAPPKPSSAPKGPARPETALQARPALGTGVSAAAISGLQDELQRRWNPNCDVEGGRDVQVRVTFTIGAGGQVVDQPGNRPRSEIKSAQTPVSETAAQRALSAVYAAAPYRSLPREFYGQQVAVTFNAREACSR
jgi:protein TonB